MLFATKFWISTIKVGWPDRLLRMPWTTLPVLAVVEPSIEDIVRFESTGRAPLKIGRLILKVAGPIKSFSMVKLKVTEVVC